MSEKLRKSIMPGNVLHIVIVIEITKHILNCEIVLQKLSHTLKRTIKKALQKVLKNLPSHFGAM